ncbi:MAG: ThiF family adenylyltransferase [Armatimonadetes bacterium]|nr:ThiF family adenylyltransferase [Armatimonadota bacterium]
MMSGLQEKAALVHGPVDNATVVIVGAGLTGSALLDMVIEQWQVVLVDFDVVEEATRLAPAFRTSRAGAFKAQVAARRRRALGRGWTVALPLSVHDLGEGFWRRVSRCRPAAVVDATDNGAAHAAIAVAAKRFGLPVIQTGIGGLSGVVRTFAPQTQEACWRCLGMPESSQRQSCLSGTVAVNPDEVAARPTRAHPAAAAATAALALVTLHRVLSAPETQSAEFRLELRSGCMQSAALKKADDCDHTPAAEPILEIPTADSHTRIEKILRCVPQVRSRYPLILWRRGLVAEVVCAGCGWLRRQWTAIGGRLRRCPECGGAELLVAEDEVHAAVHVDNIAELAPADIGMPLWPILWLSNGETAVGLELSGDIKWLGPLARQWRTDQTAEAIGDHV